MSGLLSEQTIEEIKRRTSLTGLIGEYVTLKKKGATYKGLCPFHNEKTPSFHVDEGRGFYHCFGCHAGGDAISFLREHVGYSFTEAVQLLADRLNMIIETEPQTENMRAQRRQKRVTKERLFSCNGKAQLWFKNQLKGISLNYLTESRKLNRETIEAYGLGFAPESWDGLTNALCTDWQTQRDAESLGLITLRKNDGRSNRDSGKKGYYDRFRNRVMFPVFALGGEVVGFQGRTLSNDKETPKYVNSSESNIFVKGQVLYGLFQAKRAIRQKSRVVVVEGNIDVLTMAQHGFEETVAPMGTALTPEQAVLLRRFAEQIIVIYDGDNAGRAAALKSIPILLNAGLNGRVVSLPNGEDPDTYLSKQGSDALETLINSAAHLFDFAVANAIEDYDGSVAMRDQVIAAIAPVFASLSSSSQRDGYLGQLARRLAVSEPKLQQWLNQAASRAVPRPTAAPKGEPQPENQAPRQKAPRRERDLMSLLLQHPELLPFWEARSTDWKQKFGRNLLTHEGVTLVLEGAILCFNAEDNQIDVGSLLNWLSERGRASAGTVVAKILTSDDPFDTEAERAFVDLVDALEANVGRQIKNAKRAGLDNLADEDQVAELDRWSQLQ